MTHFAAAIAKSSAGDGTLIVTATGTGSSAPILMKGIHQAVGGWRTSPTERELAAEDAMWDSVAVRHAEAIDRLFASLDQQMAKGDDEPLDIDNL